MAAVTKLVGANGIVTIGTAQAVVDFTITIKRGTASQSRVGKWSDRKVPGKVDVTGSLTFQDISGAMLARLLNTAITSPVSVAGAATFTLVGQATPDAGVTQVQLSLANCFFTDGSMKFGDANKIIDGPMSFTMQDPDADLTLTYT